MEKVKMIEKYGDTSKILLPYEFETAKEAFKFCVSVLNGDIKEPETQAGLPFDATNPIIMKNEKNEKFVVCTWQVLPSVCKQIGIFECFDLSFALLCCGYEFENGRYEKKHSVDEMRKMFENETKNEITLNRVYNTQKWFI